MLAYVRTPSRETCKGVSNWKQLLLIWPQYYIVLKMNLTEVACPMQSFPTWSCFIKDYHADI